ncbi:MAG: hypothetical protein O3A87_02325 [Verrucomicrobia bacterium]|nr:hypothetical protein [Verrucomicrobiota bacterium]MDA1005305.1 hypothetical protein [Verrucomicrobiota bacterium]
MGDEGLLLADYGKRILLPEEKYQGYEAPEPSIPASAGHYAEWLAACKTGSATTCNFEYSGSLREHNLPGCAAYRAGKKLEWDAGAMEVTSALEAGEFLTRVYREGWEI